MLSRSKADCPREIANTEGGRTVQHMFPRHARGESLAPKARTYRRLSGAPLASVKPAKRASESHYRWLSRPFDTPHRSKFHDFSISLLIRTVRRKSTSLIPKIALPIPIVGFFCSHHPKRIENTKLCKCTPESHPGFILGAGAMVRSSLVSVFPGVRNSVWGGVQDLTFPLLI